MARLRELEVRHAIAMLVGKQNVISGGEKLGLIASLSTLKPMFSATPASLLSAWSFRTLFRSGFLLALARSQGGYQWAHPNSDLSEIERRLMSVDA